MNEKPSGSPGDLSKTIGENCFCLYSRMSARAVTRQYNSIPASLGLEVTEFSLLAALTISEDTSITTLAERLAFECTTLVRNLKNMAARGLEAGYEKFLRRELPSVIPLQVVGSFQAAHPVYKWFNRVQCMGVGSALVQEGQVQYGYYAIR